MAEPDLEVSHDGLSVGSKGRGRRLASRRAPWFVLGVFTIGALVGAAVFLGLYILPGPLADTILANAIGPADHEFPPTAVPIRPSSDDVQLAGGQGVGLDCSLPAKSLLERSVFRRNSSTAPLSLQMRQACVFHDYCYRHGAATYGYTQADCDYLLQEQAFRLCPRSNASAGVSRCETAAREVTLGVRLGGAESFHLAQPRPARAGGFFAEAWARLRPWTPDKQQELPSTFFEFDPYPVRSLGYTVTRVADSPAQWIRDHGAIRKSLYIFSVRRSGLRVNVVGFGTSGRRLCASFEAAGAFNRITLPPTVLHHAASGADWLVWPQRTSVTLDNTDVHFDGIAPARATLQDWRQVFGSVVLRRDVCPDFAYLEGSASRPDAYFSKLQPKWASGAPADALISEFHGPIDGRQPGFDLDKLHLFGLTTHGCSTFDQSTCVGHLKVDAVAKNVVYEPYRTLDPNCILPRHALAARAKQAREAAGSKRRDCDFYRSFVTPPLVLSRDGTPTLAWLRRGESNGDFYQESAYLRFGPARSPQAEFGPDGVATVKLGNFSEIKLPTFAENLEPAVLARTAGGLDAFVSLVHSRDCAVAFQLTMLVPARHEVSSTPPPCMHGLGTDWIARPFALVRRTELILVKSRIELPIGGLPRSVAIHVEVATASLQGNGLSFQAETLRDVFVFNVCDVVKASDAKWTLSARACDPQGGVQYGRIRNWKEEAQLRDEIVRVAIGAVNSSPIIPAFLDDDDLVDLALPHPLDRTKAVWLKGRRLGKVMRWSLEGGQQ
ncbi:hypothetical protein [Methylobacterium gossipiicola]|uniref:Uncharacterized protein n=1 Tax=Methylobacterium gossipiicola TaxID=582675 RepID=A0A1I2XMN3_9HYPH|nr:hypothetical protein [Methylobacterium gossipiicola]SFH14357.1 hypothetical protein SAMN05192565_1506 [Methylobacterium gossipiicola]